MFERLEEWLAGADPQATADCAHACSLGEADEVEVAAWLGTLGAHLHQRIQDSDLRRPRPRRPRRGGGSVAVTAPAAPPLPDELTALLRRMRLPYLRAAAPDVLATARAQRWDPAETLRVLLDEEVRGRDAATRAQRRRAAGLPAGKTFASWREHDSSIPPATQHALATLEWLGRAENLAVTGPSGTGKTHLVEALAHAAIDTGRRVAWFTLESLTAAVGRAGADGSVARTITRITRADLIVVDDIGMLPAGQAAAEALYRLVDAAYERRSVAVTVQPAPVGLRHDHAQDPGHRHGRPAAAPRPHRAHRGHQPAPGRGHRRQRGDPLDLDQQEIS